MSDSIFKEVTFTPHIFQKDILLTDERKFERILNILDSLAESGQIIGVFNDWFKYVYENILQFDEYDKNDIEEVLKYLQDRQRIVNSANENSEDTNEDNWMKQSLKLNSMRTFEFIFATNKENNIKAFDDIDRKTIKELQNKGSKVLPQTKENMEKLLSPILAYAEIVKVYDPYFDLSKLRYLDAIKIILKTLGFHHGNKESAILEIHTSIKILLDSNNILNWGNINSYVKEITYLEKYYNHNIKIFIWEDKRDDKWHDRWIVTNQCAVTLGKGSDISEWTNATWGIHDYEDIPNIEKKFIQNRGEFNLIATIDKNSITKESKVLQYSEPRSQAEIEEKLKKVKDFRKRN